MVHRHPSSIVKEQPYMYAIRMPLAILPYTVDSWWYGTCVALHVCNMCGATMPHVRMAHV